VRGLLFDHRGGAVWRVQSERAAGRDM